MFLDAQRTEQLRKQRELRDERAKVTRKASLGAGDVTSKQSIESFLAQQQFEAKLGKGKRNGKGEKERRSRGGGAGRL